MKQTKDHGRKLIWGDVTGVHWKDWCWSWNSNSLATSCEELTHWKRPWCWEGLGAGEEGGDRGWDGWMVSLTRWTWVCVNSRSCWWTGRPGVLWFMGLQRVRHDWATELNWLNWTKPVREKTIIIRSQKTGYPGQDCIYFKPQKWYKPVTCILIRNLIPKIEIIY